MTLHRTFLPLALLASLVALPLAGCATSPQASAPAAPKASLPPPADAGTAIDRILAAYGGKKALDAVQSYSFSGTLFDKTGYHGGGVDVPFTRILSRPDRLRVEIARKDGTEVRITDGQRGWRNSSTGGELHEVTGTPLNGMLMQTARARLPWILDEMRQTIRLGNPMTVTSTKPDGKSSTINIVVLNVPIGGMSLKVMAFADTYLIAGVGGYLRPEDPQPLFETHFGGYSPTGGVMFPSAEKTFAGPVDTGAQIITTVTVNPKLSGNEFKP